MQFGRQILTAAGFQVKINKRIRVKPPIHRATRRVEKVERGMTSVGWKRRQRFVNITAKTFSPAIRILILRLMRIYIVDLLLNKGAARRAGGEGGGANKLKSTGDHFSLETVQAGGGVAVPDSAQIRPRKECTDWAPSGPPKIMFIAQRGHVCLIPPAAIAAI
ncbi:hypothetical protein GQ54DRAFT_222514 [Martensiomyces pterosporus]|nr:hypothetical protein GQ54DRAFT_222514 [Martensiomyces pterosporus]